MWVRREEYEQLKRLAENSVSWSSTARKWYIALREAEKGIKRLVKKNEKLKELLNKNGISYRKEKIIKEIKDHAA